MPSGTVKRGRVTKRKSRFKKFKAGVRKYGPRVAAGGLALGGMAAGAYLSTRGPVPKQRPPQPKMISFI